MNEHGQTISSPMLVIGVGDFAGRLLSQVQTLFLRSDQRRSALVGFYQAGGGMSAEQGEMKFEALSAQQSQGSSSLETALHDLHLHEKFLQAGLGDEQDFPLGTIVLVDLTEESSTSLYALIETLCEKMAQERGGYMYLLCKTAVFNTNPLKDVMQAHVHLQLKRLEMQIKQGRWAFQTYLFDGLKEGSLEAKDEDEVSILIQNFILALLSGRLAQKLAHAYALSDGNEGQVFYNSAGATALIYDPTVLQEICAKHLAEETLEVEFLAETLPDPGQLDKAVNTIFENIGDLPGWAEELCADTPFHTDPAEAIKLDLHFSDLQFDGLPPQEWGDAIAGYADHFEKQVQTLALEALVKNTALLIQAVGKSLDTQLSVLPTRSNLYPNGIANSLRVLQECARAFNQRLQTCLPAQNEEETLAWLDGEYQASLESLDQAINKLPDPPRWVKRLPGKLYAFAKLLFEFLFLRKEHVQLLLLREKIVRALEAKFIFQHESQVRKSMIEVCNQLLASLEKSQSELKALQAKFHNLKNKFGQADPVALSAASPFRVHLISPALLEWAYERGQKNSAEICVDLLEEGLLDNWRNISEESLFEELFSVCYLAYQFLNDLQVDEILKHTDFADHAAALALLAQGAVPALRPDFDTAGESSSYLMNYFLCADPRTSGIPNNLNTSVHERREWQEVPTGDPYTVLFCRVRQLIPLDALALLIRSSEDGFGRLSEQEQKELQESFEKVRL